MIDVNRGIIFNNFQYDRKNIYDRINKTQSQISSGKKIQHSYEDSVIFTKSIKIDDEVKDLDNIKIRTQKAKDIADSSDSLLSDFVSDVRDFRTKLISAATSTLNSNDYQILANELEGIKKHMMGLANTKVNGIYLFSGTNTNVRPIDENGNYHGNDKELTTIISKDITTPYSVDGKSIFLGDTNKNKVISTNVMLKNQSTGNFIKNTDQLRDLIKNPTTDGINFFISGKKHNGDAFKSVVSMKTTSTINDLLDKIGEAFGNTNDTKFVDVTLNDNGSISIKDLTTKKSNLSLNIVGFQGGNSDTQRDLTQVTYDNIIQFTKSDFRSPLSVEESLNTDAYYFQKEGAILTSNTPLIYNEEFATPSVKLEELANGSLNGKVFKLDLVNVNGESKQVEVNLSNNNPPTVDYSTFTLKGNPDTTYNIYNADGTRTNAKDMTLGQLNDIISMVVADTLPTSTNSLEDFNNAIIASRDKVKVDIDSGGRLSIKDKTTTDVSQIKFAIYDKDANNFSTSTLTPTISFMSNNLITTVKPEIDFFKDLDNMIKSVREGKINITDNSTNPRLISIEDSLEQIDTISANLDAQQSKIGIYSKRLDLENQKALTLQTNVKLMQSNIEDIDLAQTITKLNTLTLNYQAILSTISKVNSLSLLSYMK